MTFKSGSGTPVKDLNLPTALSSFGAIYATTGPPPLLSNCENFIAPERRKRDASSKRPTKDPNVDMMQELLGIQVTCMDTRSR